MAEEICCPKFNPEPWEDKILEWKDKKFIKASVFTLFYMPINFGSAMTKLSKLAKWQPGEEVLCLSDHVSPWKMDILCEVKNNIEGADNTSLSGKFFTKVYDGDFKNTGQWMEDYKSEAKKKGLNITKFYMWYTTCPNCAKKYGKNYTVVVGAI